MNKSQLLESFFDTSAKIKRLMAQASQDQDKDRIATFFQLQVLAYLSHNENVTPSQIADNFFMSSSAVAQLIDRLITSKWVLRIHDEKDRRVVHLSLTNEGKTELERLKKIKRERLEPLLKHLSEEDLKQLIAILDRVYSSMSNELPGGKK